MRHCVCECMCSCHSTAVGSCYLCSEHHQSSVSIINSVKRETIFSRAWSILFYFIFLASFILGSSLHVAKNKLLPDHFEGRLCLCITEYMFFWLSCQLFTADVSTWRWLWVFSLIFRPLETPRLRTTTIPVALGSSSRSTTRRVAPCGGEKTLKSHKNHNQFICGFFWNLTLYFNSHVFKTPVLLYKSRSHESFFYSLHHQTETRPCACMLRMRKSVDVFFKIFHRGSFDSACLSILRAYVEKYLLEKSRLVYQEHNERWVRHAEIREWEWVTPSLIVAICHNLPRNLFKKNQKIFKDSIFMTLLCCVDKKQCR